MCWNMLEHDKRFRQSTTSLLRKVCIFVALVLLSGCATYRPLPITPDTVNATLISPDMNAVRLRADKFKHPLLRSVPFDERDGLSPDEAALLAVMANPTLRAVRDRRGIAAAQLMQAGILPNPQLSYDLGIPVGTDSQNRVNSFGLGLGWDITAIVSRGARLDAARAHTAAVNLDVAWQEWQVAEDARLHTYRLVIARQRLAAAKQAERFFQRWQQEMERAVAIGVRTQPDLAAVNVSLQHATAQVCRAQAQMEQERLALNRALGLPPQQMVAVEKNIAWQIDQSLDADMLCENGTNKRVDLLALKLGYASQEARLRSAVRSQFPNINLVLNTGRDTDSLKTIGVGVTIDLPFFDHNQGHIALERASRQQLFDDYNARLFAMRADINQLVAAIEATRVQLVAIDKSLLAQKLFAENLRQAAEAGQVEVFSYNNALQAVYDQQSRKTDLEQKMVELGIALEVASGQYGIVGAPGAKEHQGGA